jgi:hypothetical protein
MINITPQRYVFLFILPNKITIISLLISHLHHFSAPENTHFLCIRGGCINADLTVKTPVQVYYAPKNGRFFSRFYGAV